MVSEEMLTELNNILRTDYGLELNPREISAIGNSLVDYFELLTKMNKKNDQENIQKENI